MCINVRISLFDFMERFHFEYSFFFSQIVGIWIDYYYCFYFGIYFMIIFIKLFLRANTIKIALNRLRLLTFFWYTFWYFYLTKTKGIYGFLFLFFGRLSFWESPWTFKINRKAEFHELLYKRLRDFEHVWYKM